MIIPPSNYTFTQKRIISHKIKSITHDEAINDFKKLQNLNGDFTEGLRPRTGNKTVDYFSFYERLNTKSKRDVSFYDIWYNRTAPIIAEQKYIKNYFKSNEERFSNMTEELKWYNMYSLYFGSVGLFLPSYTVKIIQKYKPKIILDPFSGWGSRLIGAMSQNTNYIGYDTNTELYPVYKNIIQELIQYTENKTQNYKITIKPAETVDYSILRYDMVFTSPPYYNLELYTNTTRKTKDEWNSIYRTVFYNSYKHLQRGGYFVINCNQNIYEGILIPLIEREADERILFLKSRQTVGDYSEYIYVWKKTAP